MFQSLELPYELLFFEKGESALEYLRTTSLKPFIIITDINLPGMIGLQLREEIMKEEYLREKSIPFIFLSTSNGEHILKKVYQMQVQGYFQKANTVEDVKNQVRLIFDYWKVCKHPNL